MFFVVVVKWHFAFDEDKCPDGQMRKRNHVDNNDDVMMIRMMIMMMTMIRVMIMMMVMIRVMIMMMMVSRRDGDL